MTRFQLDPSAPARLSHATKSKLASQTEDEIEAISNNDPDHPPSSDEMLERGIVGRRVRLARQKLGLGQVEFANRFRIPIGTLRDWEQGRRKPDAPSIAYLTVIERNPDAVMQALTAA